MLLQRSIIFRPKRLPEEHIFQGKYPLVEYFFDFEVEGNKFLINAVHIKALHSKGLVFFLHGTVNHIQYHLPKADFFIELGYDVVMIDYPKYGKSKGNLTERLLHIVVELSYQKTLEKIGYPKSVVLYGRSLGTALASNLATKVHPDKLILVSPYFSMPDLFNHKLKLLSFKRLKFKLENFTYLPLVKCDTYIFHGINDRLIPIELACKLIPFLNSPEYFFSVPGADHFNVHEMSLYKNTLKVIL